MPVGFLGYFIWLIITDFLNKVNLTNDTSEAQEGHTTQPKLY